ncbi:hypothetical protein HPB51_029783 [Rhipicephalus microplus]|uniref:Uncharacterized protein n=1 Tax=Rhipicephalus microplus TaxID=6941 RepID=A0A9J6CTX4_RHIMP|nr:hypothetical protein HPB51_029783 [Rhipicephalus microplus]
MAKFTVFTPVVGHSDPFELFEPALDILVLFPTENFWNARTFKSHLRKKSGLRWQDNAKAPFLAAAQEESDLTRVKASWCWEQYNRTQPWSITMSPRKVSPTLSFKEFANHLSSNLDAFHCKDFTLPFKSLTTGCWCWQIVMMLLVCATFKLHNKGDKVTFWSTKTTMLSGKNRKLLVATAVALPLLYIVDTWTVVTWSFGVTTVIGFVRASLCAGPGASPEDHGRLNSMPFAS